MAKTIWSITPYFFYLEKKIYELTSKTGKINTQKFENLCKFDNARK